MNLNSISPMSADVLTNTLKLVKLTWIEQFIVVILLKYLKNKTLTLNWILTLLLGLKKIGGERVSVAY